MADLTALLDASNNGLLDASGNLLTFGSGGLATTNDFFLRYGPSFYIDTILVRRDDSPPKNY